MSEKTSTEDTQVFVDPSPMSQLEERSDQISEDGLRLLENFQIQAFGLVGDCMRSEGFDYTVNPQPLNIEIFEQSRPYRHFDYYLQYVTEVGYGVADDFFDKDNASELIDLNAQYLATLDPIESAAYYETLSGGSDGGCLARSFEKTATDLSMNGMDSEFEVLLSELEDQIEGSPEQVEILRNWQNCASRLGIESSHPDYVGSDLLDGFGVDEPDDFESSFRTAERDLAIQMAHCDYDFMIQRWNLRVKIETVFIEENSIQIERILLTDSETRKGG